MARAEVDQSARRSVVPEAAGRSLWLAAIWTGVGAAIVCATAAIITVAILWLPVSSASHGRTSSAIHAGLLTFLASLHGGITIDGVHGQWLPLGMMLAVAVTAWRAGSGLADAAQELGEADPARLAVAGGTQILSFAVAALVTVPIATLGTSDAPFLGVGLSAVLLFAVSGGVAFIRSSGLRDHVLELIPPWVGEAAHAAAAAIVCYLGLGTLVMIGSLGIHHQRVAALAQQVGGGGWGGVPILLLGILAAPNAVIAGASYLSGAGFAVGSGATVSLTTSAHGTLPAFPLLAAIPSGQATTAVWVLAGLTIALPGVLLGALACRASGVLARLERVGLGALCVALAMTVLGWQSGGSVGSGHLATFGPSPLRLGLFTGLESGVAGLVVVGLAAAIAALRADHDDLAADASNVPEAANRRLSAVEAEASGSAESGEGGRLAG